MSSAIILVFAVLLDRLWGEFIKWHPLVGFGHGVKKIEAWFNVAPEDNVKGRLLGVISIVLLIVPVVVLSYFLADIGILGVVFEVFILYLAIGSRSLQEHGMRVYDALMNSDIEQARTEISMIVSRDTDKLNATEISSATVESVLENGCDAIFGALFWFMVAGAPGVVLYRLSNTLDAMWGYKTQRFNYFGWAAARLDDVLNYIPARLTAFSYAALGKFSMAMYCWREQAGHWKSPNAGPVMSAGAGALCVELGGSAVYQGQQQRRPILGKGKSPDYRDIKRAVDLVNRSLMLWVAVIIVIFGVLESA